MCVCERICSASSLFSSISKTNDKINLEKYVNKFGKIVFDTNPRGIKSNIIGNISNRKYITEMPGNGKGKG